MPRGGMVEPDVCLSRVRIALEALAKKPRMAGLGIWRRERPNYIDLRTFSAAFRFRKTLLIVPV
jgi:hypothetical protein